jgi:pyruvate,water dikinase
MSKYIVWFKECSYHNKHLVGGKCSSLGELSKLSETIGFNIADGFAITTYLYDTFIFQNDLHTIIENTLDNINTNDMKGLERSSNYLKNLIVNGSFTQDQKQYIYNYYNKLCDIYNTIDLEVAIRSSAIAEDLPNASFAGQQDTYLNIKGLKSIEYHIKKCFASLFNAHAISYRKEHNIHINDVKISVAIQKMVRSDIGSAGVGFSIDTETGYERAIVINSSFGLGELVVSGGVKPDEFIVDKRTLTLLDNQFCDPIIMKKKGDKNSKIVYHENGGVLEVETNKFERDNYSLSDQDIVKLSKFIHELEINYCKLFNKKIAVDVEWALDGIDKNIYIIQTRPETIHNNKDALSLKKYILLEKSNILASGVAVGEKITTGKIKYLKNVSEFEQFNKGDILLTEMTTPDWEPIMKISSGIITNKGGRTCHAAIVSRELGINAIVGAGNATNILKDHQEVTISCSEGEIGYIYEGILNYKIEEINLDTNIDIPVKLMLNVGNPENSFSASLIPNSGVGLARIEFIISNYIKIHPLTLYNYPNLPEELNQNIKNLIGDEDAKNYFRINLARGLAKIASAFYPNNVIVRFSDFKTNEYKNLMGGYLYEPDEENPMIGWRGASRYYSPEYEHAFELECQAIKYAREIMMMDNIVVMIPFCRTPKECELVIKTMAKYGLVRGENKLKVYLMCEIPSNVIESDLFSDLIDGVSIGGNDLLQLTIGVDRDSERITHLSDYDNVSYKRMICMAIDTYKEKGVKVGFCGQQPSDSISFCKFLIDSNIDSISVTPDSAISAIKNLNKTSSS